MKMQTLRALTTAAALVACAASARAADGVLITEKTTTSNGTSETSQVQIEKTRMRAEAAGANNARQVVIFDGTAQVMRLIDMDKKTYTEMTKADVDRMADQMAGAMAQMQDALKNLPPEQRAQMEQMMRGRGMPAAAPAVQYRKTGTDKVGKWTCDKYEGTVNGQKTSEVCTVSPAALGFTVADFEVTRQMADFFKKLMPQNADQLFRLGSDDQGFSGIPVRQVHTVAGMTVTSELVDVARQNFPDSTFAVPAGFQKQAFPGIGGAAGGRRGR